LSGLPPLSPPGRGEEESRFLAPGRSQVPPPGPPPWHSKPLAPTLGSKRGARPSASRAASHHQHRRGTRMPACKRLAALLPLAAAAYLGLAALDTGSAAAYGDKGKVVTVTAKDKDKEGKVKLARGETLEVRLPSNRTTGFSWQIGKIDKNKLKPQGK